MLLFSCRKDVKPITQGTTPYQFDYPDILSQYLPPIDEPTDNPTTEEGVKLGRYLFYDKRLSGDGTQACASCHMPQFSFSDTSAFSLGIDGLEGSRNAMPIINPGWMENGLFWDGRATSIEDQALKPVVNPVEMHSNWSDVATTLQSDPDYPSMFLTVFGSEEIDSIKVVKAIAQFERTLMSGNAPFDKYLMGNMAQGSSGWSADKELLAYQGFIIFMGSDKGDCFHCHGDQFNPLWTDNKFHNNGLDANAVDKGLEAYTGDPSDHGKFKTPTLRNLAFTAPYMHDGRFQTLGEVIQQYCFNVKSSSTVDPLMQYAYQGGVQLNPQEQNALKWFLLSLSDSSFVTNPDFQDPW